MILGWIVCLIHIRFDGLEQFLVKSGINEQALKGRPKQLGYWSLWHGLRGLFLLLQQEMREVWVAPIHKSSCGGGTKGTKGFPPGEVTQQWSWADVPCACHNPLGRHL